MPITIKELLLSDVISEVVEKVNFNFDQLVLAGGGPPGIQGIQGLAGPIGPIGARGDHWFVGPTAFGQTADHDGTDLQIQDLFLDSDGNVYKYFEISGSTGWTYSGINLKGPSGIQGVTGGGLEWSIYLGSTEGNAIDSNSYTPKILGTSIDTNFLIPNATKDSIFLGDPSWAYNKLADFGANILFPDSFVDRIRRMPKLSIIQSEVNTYGMNGLVFGAYGATTSLVSSAAYGSAGSTTSAFDFVNVGFGTEFDNNEAGPSLYRTRFKLISPRASVKFEIGGIPTNANQGQKRIARFETFANETSFRDWEDKKYINIEDRNTAASPVIANLREISLVSKQNFPFTTGNTGIYSNLIPTTGATNIYGYIALQNDIGTNPNSQGWPEHDYGNVIIGPVKLSGANLGFASPQGLAIVRKITKHDTVDAAIRFFQVEYVSGASTEEFKIKSTFGGAITPVRIADSNLSNFTLDTLAISSGLGNSIPGVTAAGRIGFTNNVLTAFKPQHAFHVSMSKDVGTRNRGWDDGGIFSSGELDMFYAGFDNDPIPGSTGARNSGIGFASKSYVDLAGVTHSVPIIQTYYRLKTGTFTPNDYNSSGIGQGQYAPHLYIQPHDSSNIGIGFSPNPLILGTGGTGYWPLAKVSINGGVVIGSTAQGYHNVLTNRPSNGILVETTIIVGATTISDQYKTSLATATQVIEGNGIGYSNVSASFNQFAFSRFFLSKDSGVNPGFPEFGFSDFRTGIRMGIENRGGYTAIRGVGQLIASPNANQLDNINGGDPLLFPKIAAEWKSTGEYFRDAGSSIVNGNPYSWPEVSFRDDYEYSNLKANDTFSSDWQYQNLDQLEVKILNTNITGGRYGTAKWRGIYYIIPTNKSGCILNADGTYNGTWTNGKQFYVNSLEDPSAGGDTTIDYQILNNPGAGPGPGFQFRWYLDGESYGNAASRLNARIWNKALANNSNISVTLIPRYQLNNVYSPFPVNYTQMFNTSGIAGYYLTTVGDVARYNLNALVPNNYTTLEEGHFHGQKFSLLVSRIDSRNNIYMDGYHLPLKSISNYNVVDTLSAGAYASYIKGKIVFPRNMEADGNNPGDPWDQRYSSRYHHRQGAFLQGNTLYEFVWLFSDYGIYGDSQFFNGTSLGDTRAYLHNGAWVCTSATRLTQRDALDFGNYDLLYNG